MKAPMITPDNYAGKGLLANCRLWQGVIDSAPTPAEKDAFGQLACEALSGIAREHGSPKILVRSYRAVVLTDEPAPGQDHELIEFDKVVATGWLGRINYLVMNQERAITWPIYSARVLNQSEKVVTATDMAEDSRSYLPTDIVAGPIHLPVCYIDFATFSA